MKTITISLLSILLIISLVGCTDTIPNKGGKFTIVSAETYGTGLSKFRINSVLGFGNLSFVDSANKYSVGDTIKLSKN